MLGEVLKQAPLPCIILDADSLKIEEANPSAEHLGYSCDELVGMRLSDLFYVPGGDGVNVRLHSKTGHGLWNVRYRDGQTRLMQAVHFPVAVGDRQLVAVYLMRDKQAREFGFVRAEWKRQLEIFLQFNSRIARSTSLSDLCRAVGESTSRAFEQIQAVSLWVRHENGEKLQLAFASGYNDVSHLRNLARGLGLRALCKGGKIRTEHREQSGLPEPFDRNPAFAEARSVALVPLLAGGESVGLIIISSLEAQLEFGALERSLLHAFAVQAGIEIQRLLLTEHVREASRHLVEAQEAERRAISQDMHDEIGGLLNSLRLSLKMTGIDIPSASKELGEALLIVDELIAHVRDLAFRLSPRMLVDLGLVSTISSYTKRFTARTRVNAAFHSEVDPDARFRTELESTAFRVVQESLTNASKHSAAESVEVYLQENESSLVVHVIDNGTGFDPESAAQDSTKMGLQGLRERLELIGGDIEIASGKGDGTRITAILPK